MLSHNPFEMPELAALVASYLTGKDLASCVRVSKNWRDMFLPIVGDALEICHMKDYEMFTHPNLRDLEIMIDSEHRPLDWDLAAKSPLLERLSLINIVIGLGWLQGLPYLRKLDLKCVIIRHGPGFWEACKNLEILLMEHVHFEGGFVPIPADTVFARLRTLRIRLGTWASASEQPALIPHCPNLETFEWNPPLFEVRILIQHPIHKDRCPLLNNLSIPEKPLDAEWASVIE
ncbi:hypothetical protein BGX34_000581 [Mortierella sp. NVP85]|nr:hypothetical protein BGX34_000581 [Mortierella sp. NVP85]